MSGHPEVAINVAENLLLVIKNLTTYIFLSVYDRQLKSFKVASFRTIRAERMLKPKKNNNTVMCFFTLLVVIVSCSEVENIILM